MDSFRLESLAGGAIGDRCGFPSLGGCSFHSGGFYISQSFLSSDFVKFLLQAEDLGDGDLGCLSLALKLIMDKLDKGGFASCEAGGFGGG